MRKCRCGNEIFLMLVDRFYVEAKVSNKGLIEISEPKIRKLNNELKCKACGRNWMAYWDFATEKWLYQEVMGPNGIMAERLVTVELEEK